MTTKTAERKYDAATGAEIFSDETVGGIVGGGLGGLLGYGSADAGLRMARRSRNTLIKSMGRHRALRTALAGTAAAAGAVGGSFAGSMMMGGTTKFYGIPKQGSLLPSPSAVLPTKGGVAARAVLPSTIARNVKQMKAVPIKIAGVNMPKLAGFFDTLSTAGLAAASKGYMMHDSPSKAKRVAAKALMGAGGFVFRRPEATTAIAGAAALGGAAALHKREKKAEVAQKDGDLVHKTLSTGKQVGSMVGGALGAGLGAVGMGTGAAFGVSSLAKGVSKKGRVGRAALGLAGLVGGAHTMSRGVANMNAGATGVATYKKASQEPHVTGYSFKKKDASPKPAGKPGFAFKKKAEDGSKEAASFGDVEGDPGAFSDAFSAFLGDSFGVVTQKRSLEKMDNGSERR